jgi:antitoxin HigA-1
MVGFDLWQLALDLRVRGPARHERRFSRLPLSGYERGDNTMSRMHNPPHPGEVVKELCLDPLGLTVTAAADGLGVARRTLSTLLNGHAGISPDMAIRLSKAFGRSPESWLQLQLQYDLWQAEQRSDTIKVKHFPTPAAC